MPKLVLSPNAKVLLRSALIRSARTFLQAFVAVLIASGTGYLTIPVLHAAAVAGGAALLALAQRYLDETGVPSLSDTVPPHLAEAVLRESFPAVLAYLDRNGAKVVTQVPANAPVEAPSSPVQTFSPDIEVVVPTVPENGSQALTVVKDDSTLGRA